MLSRGVRTQKFSEGVEGIFPRWFKPPSSGKYREAPYPRAQQDVEGRS